jgi:hypothetical protein
MRHSRTSAVTACLLLMTVPACSDEREPEGSSPGATSSPSAQVDSSHSPTIPSPEERTAGDPIVGVIEGFTQGAEYYGVYVFVGGFDDPGYDRSIRRLRRMDLKRGVNFSDGELRCDEGAAEGLGLSDDGAGAAIAVAVYFHRETDAHAFAASLDTPPEGVVRIRALCAD